MTVIPVRVPFDAKPVLGSDRVFRLSGDHPLFTEPCPVCGQTLGNVPVVLILAGIEPSSRTDHGYCTGAAVAVHADCAGRDLPM